jgi:hypothetical protein
MVHCVLGRVFSGILWDGTLCLRAIMFWSFEGYYYFRNVGYYNLTANLYITKTSVFILSPVSFYSMGAGEWVEARQPTPKQTREIRPFDLNWERHETYNYIYMYTNAVAVNVILGRSLYL